jgi:hypothetical protein
MLLVAAQVRERLVLLMEPSATVPLAAEMRILNLALLPTLRLLIQEAAAEVLISTLMLATKAAAAAAQVKWSFVTQERKQENSNGTFCFSG